MNTDIGVAGSGATEAQPTAQVLPFDLAAHMDKKRTPAHLAVKCTQIKTAMGMMTACASEQGICILEFDDSGRVERQIARYRRLTSASFKLGRNTHLSQLRCELNEYLKGGRWDFSLSFDLQGTQFQCAVWNALLSLPYGARISYGDLADSVGQPKAIRAAAAANGANPLSILVPCHRVMGSNGKITGYGGGIERKAWLLDHESKHIKAG